MSGTAYTARENVHQPTGKIGKEDKIQTEQTVFHNNDFVGIQVKQGFCEEQTERTHACTDDRNQYTTLNQNLKTTFELTGSGVLTDEAYRGLVEGVHRGIDEAFEVARGSITCHRIRTEGVDGGLDEDVRDGEHRALQSCRKSDPGNLNGDFLIDGKLFKVKLIDGVITYQTDNNADCGESLGNNCCQCNTCDIHMQDNNEDKIHSDVDEACDGQEQERTDGVADGAQDGACKVIKKHNRHAGKIYAHVECGKVDNVCRGIHQRQEWLCKNDADNAEEKTADNRKRNRRMDRFFDLTFLIGSVVTGYQNINADGKPYKYVDQEVD